MTDTLFISYHHGCKGERLAVQISRHELFRTLEARSVNGRTIIKNDYFDKKFLNSWRPSYKDLCNRTGQNLVVPSHYFYDDLKSHYPDSVYVTIDVPEDLDAYRNALYERFFLYSTNDTVELIGECENRIREYNKDISIEDVRRFTADVLKNKITMFGDIRCMAKGIPATEANRRYLANQHTPSDISAETRSNSLVIAYEDVDSLDTETVVDYFRRSSGSL